MQISNILICTVIIFSLGVWGLLLNNKNVLIMLMAIEIILVSINLNFIIFSIFLDDLVGHVFAIYILTVAAAEISIGLAIMMVYYREKGDIQTTKISTLRF